MDVKIPHNEHVVASGSLGGPLFLFWPQDDRMIGSADDRRIMSETGIALRIAGLVEPVIEDMGYRLVRVRMTGDGGGTVQIMAERPDGSLSIDDCVDMTRVLSPLLDVDDPVPGGYRLEISSPGIARPLVRPEDFERWAGFEAKIELRELLAGRKRFRGILDGFADGEVRLETELSGFDEPQTVGLPFEAIHEARLVMTDTLLKSSGNAGRGTETGGSAGDRDT